MTTQSTPSRGMPRSLVGTAIAAALAAAVAAAAPTPVSAAAPRAERPTASTMTLSVGRGQLVRLSAPMSDLFVADDKIADVQVRSPTQLYVFGKGPGETTIYATSKSGGTVYSATVRVGTNLDNVQTMLRLAMPDAAIVATPMNGLVLITGTVATPEDVEEASRLVQAFVGKDTQVVSRLKTATPLQVSLHVRIAEVSHDVSKVIGVNLESADFTSGFKFGVGQGRGSFPQYNPGGGLGVGPPTLTVGTGLSGIQTTGAGTTLGLAGKLLGLNLLAALDLAETNGLVTTLAEPNLTAISGETASFLAGGEIPIPQSQGLGAVSVEYKEYGVSLSFTPTVLADGRISLRVRPEVSQLSQAGAVTINSFSIPALTTRRAETTVELGSGQSFMIGGLLSNSRNNSIDKAPFLGDLPILGALFRSNTFRHSESELVIVVTPYLVKPVSTQIALPTDGYKAPTDFERIIGGHLYEGKSDAPPPQPRAVAPVAAPGIGALGANDDRKAGKSAQAAAAPGFSFN